MLEIQRGGASPVRAIKTDRQPLGHEALGLAVRELLLEVPELVHHPDVLVPLQALHHHLGAFHDAALAPAQDSDQPGPLEQVHRPVVGRLLEPELGQHAGTELVHFARLLLGNILRLQVLHVRERLQKPVHLAGPPPKMLPMAGRVWAGSSGSIGSISTTTGSSNSISSSVNFAAGRRPTRDPTTSWRTLTPC